MGYYFDDIIKIEDLNLDDVSIDEKLYKNILIYNISHKNLIANPLRIIFHKQTDLLDFMMKLDISYYLEVKNMIPFTASLDIL